MNTPKIESFSYSKSGLIITYSDNGKEINAIIGPFLVCTYLCNLHWIKDRQLLNETLFVDYKNEWLTWREFLIAVPGEWWEVRIGRILDHHIETEAFKNFYYTSNN